MKFRSIFLICLTIGISHQYIFDGCKGEADVVFLVDGSEDAHPSDFEVYLKIVRQLVTGLEVYSTKTRVGVSLVTHSGQETVNLADFSDKQLLLTGIYERTQRVGDVGSLGDSIQRVRSHQFVQQAGDRLNVTDTIVVIGGERMDFHSSYTRQQFKSLKEAGFTVILVIHGYNNNKDQVLDELLGELASSPKHVFHVTDARDFEVRLPDVKISLCESIPACSGIADIAFMVDISGSISVTHWHQMINFVVKIVENMYISPNGVSIAFATFDTEAKLIFNFQTHHNKEDTISAIMEVTFTEGLI